MKQIIEQQLQNFDTGVGVEVGQERCVAADDKGLQQYFPNITINSVLSMPANTP